MSTHPLLKMIALIASGMMFSASAYPAIPDTNLAVNPGFEPADIGTYSVYFDVANAPDHATSLSPNYVGGANALVTASSLLAHGVSPSYDCCIDGPGDFIFTGWQVKEYPLDYSKYIEFTITASSPITLVNLEFTGFGGDYNSRGGPRTAFVRSSNDGFNSNITQFWSGNYWNMWQTTPYISDSPNDFIYDLSGLSALSSGETMAFRFYFANTDYGNIPGGFWNKPRSRVGWVAYSQPNISTAEKPQQNRIFRGIRFRYFSRLRNVGLSPPTQPTPDRR